MLEYKYSVYRETSARFLIWRFGEFGKDRQIKKLANVDYCMCSYGAKNSDHQIKKIHQYLLRANLPNLMLAKFSRYTVYKLDHFCALKACQMNEW